jgi:hypothetical protein
VKPSRAPEHGRSVEGTRDGLPRAVDARAAASASTGRSSALLGMHAQ